MTMLRSALLLAGLLTLLAPAPAPAAERALALAPEGTRLSFLLHANTHDVHGTFGLKEGALRFQAEGGPASGRIVMSAASAETGNERRDKKMHLKVLESAAFPDFVFTLQSTEGALAGDGVHDITLVGTIALHGAEHPIRFPARVTLAGEALSAEADAEIPYVEWGLKDPSVAFFRVEKVVTVHVSLNGTLGPG